jgi:hypothetical protein
MLGAAEKNSGQEFFWKKMLPFARQKKSGPNGIRTGGSVFRG